GGSIRSTAAQAAECGDRPPVAPAPLRRYPVGQDASALALQRKLLPPRIGERDRNLAVRLLVDDDLPVPRARRQPRGHVGHVADRRKVLVPPTADVADELLPARNADPDLERRVADSSHE